MAHSLAQNEPDSASQASQGTTMLGTYYADKFVGRKTSCGDIFRQNQYTAAHRTLPFGTYLSVTYPLTGQSIIVKVNDRCPKSNVLDMTKIACKSLGIKGSGKVVVTPIASDIGYKLWVLQDTLALTLDEYLAFRDKSQNRRISPYSPCTKDGKNLPAITAQKTATKNAKPTLKSAGNRMVTVQQAEADTLPTNTTIVDTIPITPPHTGPTYDLELCTVSSNHAVLAEINRLPIELQPKVTLLKNEINRDVRIILALSDTRNHVVRVQAELADLFPESCVISHVQ